MSNRCSLSAGQCASSWPSSNAAAGIVRDDDVCRRLMTAPGVGPVVALTYRATVDLPARFSNSRAVGALFGLTPSNQSGETDRTGAYPSAGTK